MSAARITIAGLFVLLLPSESAVAQCHACNVPILQIPAGARAQGLGGAYVTGDGAFAIFHNPAQVGSARGTSVGFMRIGGASLGEVATTMPLGPFGFGVGARFVSGGTEPGFDDERHLASGAFVGRAAVATDFHGIWFGGAASFVTTDLGADGGGVSFDAGAAIRKFGVLIGVTGQNLGRDFRVYGVPQTLPTRVSLGVSLPRTAISTFWDLAASAAVSRERHGEIVPRGGVELSFNPVSGWRFTGRVGAQRSLEGVGQFRQGPITLGGTFGLDNLSLDYAFLPGVSGGRATHSFSLRIE